MYCLECAFLLFLHGFMHFSRGIVFPLTGIYVYILLCVSGVLSDLCLYFILLTFYHPFICISSIYMYIIHSCIFMFFCCSPEIVSVKLSLGLPIFSWLSPCFVRAWSVRQFFMNISCYVAGSSFVAAPRSSWSFFPFVAALLWDRSIASVSSFPSEICLRVS